MKKLLLGTTTLIGAAGLLSGVAFADTPKVTIGGYENFEAGFISDDLNSAANAHGANNTTTGSNGGARHDAFRSDTQLDFKIDGKADSGLGYGGEVDLLADTSSDIQDRGFNASKTFIYLSGNWGRFEMGSNVGADGTMKTDAASIARATGGINGDWNYFANAGTQFLAQAALPLQYGNPYSNFNNGYDDFTGNHRDENLDKITYYTPRFAGLQVGVSFLPDETNRGQGTGPDIGNNPNPYGPDRGYYGYESQNIFTGGINYDNKFGDVGLTLSGTGEWGKAEVQGFDDLKAWATGAKLSWMGWSIAGSYGDWGSSDTLKTDHSENTHYWDAGIAYEYGPFGASLTYLDGQYDCGNGSTAGNSNSVCFGQGLSTADDQGKNKFTNTSIGVDYKLAPGLTPYAEVSFYNQNATGTQEDNKGYVGLIGSQLNF
jgi:predicted porin